MAKDKTHYSRPAKPETSDAKDKALETAIKEIEKSFGKGAIMKLGERSSLDIPKREITSIHFDKNVSHVPHDHFLQFK